MCGRYALTTPPSQIATLFELSGALPRDWRPRYNVAQSQDIPVVRVASGGEGGGGAQRVAEMMRWGLVARWSNGPGDGPAPINARSETAATNAAFREAMKRRRCLIPADGFYEWKKLDPAGKRKQPMFIRLRGGGAFAFAGLWEEWRPKG